MASCHGIGAGARTGAHALPDGAGVDWAGGSWGLEEGPTKQKNFVNQGLLGSPSRPRVWKRLRICDHHDGAYADAKRRYRHQQSEGLQPVHDKMGVG